MARRQLTSFEHMLLGLICLQPSSGYDLKRIFAATPMGVYQPSSGALYPALRRLEQQGLVQAPAPASQGAGSARRRRVYEPTATGRAAHASWLRTPVEPATVAGDLGLHLMRFVMMEHLLPLEEVLAFLQGLADALAAFTGQLERYAAAASLSERYSRLALDHGLAVHRASLRWAQQTIAVLSAASVRCDKEAQHEARSAPSGSLAHHNNGGLLMTAPRAADEASIRQLIGKLAEAIRTMDFEGLKACFAPDMVSFDVGGPPLQTVGAEAKLKNWEMAFTAFQPPLGYEIRDLTITVGDDVAFGHSFNRLSGTSESGERLGPWVRYTAGFRKIGGKWFIVHDQVSVPADFESGRALLGLEP